MPKQKNTKEQIVLPEPEMGAGVTRIVDMKLSNRTTNKLYKLHLDTVREVYNHFIAKGSIEGLGDTCMEELREAFLTLNQKPSTQTFEKIALNTPEHRVPRGNYGYRPH